MIRDSRGDTVTGEYFLKPNFLERLMNKTIGWLARRGLGPGYVYLLEVRGRTSGKIYSTPVNRFELNGRLYLVGGRGHTGWSKNASAGGIVVLRRGRKSAKYRAVLVADDLKPPILKGYLETYSRTVQRFFAIRANSPVDEFRRIAGNHPVFELRFLS